MNTSSPRLESNTNFLRLSCCWVESHVTQPPSLRCRRRRDFEVTWQEEASWTQSPFSGEYCGGGSWLLGTVGGQDSWRSGSSQWTGCSVCVPETVDLHWGNCEMSFRVNCVLRSLSAALLNINFFNLF